MGGGGNTKSDVQIGSPKQHVLHMCADEKAETGRHNLVKTSSRPNSGIKLWQVPKVLYICNCMINIIVCMYVCMHVCMSLCMYKM